MPEEKEKKEERIYGNLGVFICDKEMSNHVKIVKAKDGTTFPSISVSAATLSDHYYSDDKIREDPELGKLNGRTEFLRLNSTSKELYGIIYNGNLKYGDRLLVTNCYYSTVEGKDGKIYQTMNMTGNSVLKKIVRDDYFKDEGRAKEDSEKGNSVTAFVRPFNFQVKTFGEEVIYEASSFITFADDTKSVIKIRARGLENQDLFDAMRKFEHKEMSVTGKINLDYGVASKGMSYTPCIDISGGESGNNNTFAVLESANRVRSVFDAQKAALEASKAPAAPKIEKENAPEKPKRKRTTKKAKEAEV